MKYNPTPVLLPGKSHGWRSLVGYSLWGCWESDRTERLHFHFSLSCIGEGNGNPLQCSCLENPRDRGAWWAAVSGVTQSRTRLVRLSSSSSSKTKFSDCISIFFCFFFFILFLNFTILYWFCQISKWICHRYTCVPHPEPSSLLPPHTIPLGCKCQPNSFKKQPKMYSL